MDFRIGICFDSALNRMPYVLLWGSMVLLQGVYWYRQGYAARREWVALGVAGVCIALGMGYKHYLNTHYGTLFLSEVLPPIFGTGGVAVGSTYCSAMV
jgi:hypothetical protein